MSFIANGEHTFRPSSGASKLICLRTALTVIVALTSLSISMAAAQQHSPQQPEGFTIQGTVADAGGKPVADAVVRIEQPGIPGSAQTNTNATGAFTFSSLKAGSYSLSAEKSGLRSLAAAVPVSANDRSYQVHLVLEASAAVHANPRDTAAPATQAMEFADQPSFTIAGVTDWTAAGGHGSDSSLRTSEALVRETVALKPEHPEHGSLDSHTSSIDTGESEDKLREALTAAPGSAEANHRLGAFYLRSGRYAEAVPLLQAACKIDPANRGNEFDLAVALKGAGEFRQAREHVRNLMALAETAELHNLAGELDEKLGDPLAAVHEYQLAVRLEPSEQNYFDWGSELLVHRAVWQAQQVFQQGAKAYPKSERMLAALGTALFAGALYDEAAQRFCEASDLNPADTEPYIFMGRIEMAAPSSLACVEQKLARFLALQPGNALANYYYAMALWKGHGKQPDPKVLQQVESLLTKAIGIDAQCGDAYLQLGVLYSTHVNYQKAIGFYEKAIVADPQLAEAHYRLGVAYDRTGEREKAKAEFQLHDDIRKQQAAAVEQQRREVKQFLVVAPGQETHPPAQ